MLLALQKEIWIWYSIVMALLIARLTSRALSFGSLKRLQIDDYIITFSAFSYTVLVVLMNIVLVIGSNLLPPGTAIDDIPPDQKEQLRYGSKLVLAAEECQNITIWSAKVCLLIMYYRVTKGHKFEHMAIKVLAGYTAVGFVIMEILLLGVWCRPISGYWALPPPSPQCATYAKHLITNLVVNISSDIALLVLALQMIIQSRLPLKRKVIMCCVFGLGIFAILSAVLSKYYSFANPFSTGWINWYVRESSTCLLVANLPFIWPLLRLIFNLKAFSQVQTTMASTTGRDRSVAPKPPPPPTDAKPDIKSEVNTEVKTEVETDIEAQAGNDSDIKSRPKSTSNQRMSMHGKPRGHNRTISTASTYVGDNSMDPKREDSVPYYPAPELGDSLEIPSALPPSRRFSIGDDVEDAV